MRPREILNHLRKQPLNPIRIYVSDGASYDVTHTAMITVTTSVVFIAQPPESDGVPERNVYCDPIHSTRLEPLDGAKPKRRRPKRPS